MWGRYRQLKDFFFCLFKSTHAALWGDTKQNCSLVLAAGD
jgi:hypothetical protein